MPAVPVFDPLIIQIISHKDYLFALDNDGNIYRANANFKWVKIQGPLPWKDGQNG